MKLRIKLFLDTRLNVFECEDVRNIGIKYFSTTYLYIFFNCCLKVVLRKINLSYEVCLISHVNKHFIIIRNKLNKLKRLL